MSEVHLTTAGVVVHNPGQSPALEGAGGIPPVVTVVGGITKIAAGQIPNTTVIIKNPG